MDMERLQHTTCRYILAVLCITSLLGCIGGASSPNQGLTRTRLRVDADSRVLVPRRLRRMRSWGRCVGRPPALWTRPGAVLGPAAAFLGPSMHDRNGLELAVMGSLGRPDAAVGLVVATYHHSSPPPFDRSLSELEPSCCAERADVSGAVALMLQPTSVWLQAKKPRGTAGLVSPAPAPTCSAPRALAAMGDSPEAIAAPYAALPHAVQLASPAVARNAPRLPDTAAATMASVALGYLHIVCAGLLGLVCMRLLSLLGGTSLGISARVCLKVRRARLAAAPRRPAQGVSMLRALLRTPEGSPGRAHQPLGAP